MTSTTSPSTASESPRRTLLGVPRPVGIAVIVLGAVVALTALALAALWFVQRGAVLPNTTVDGIDVGGMDEAALRAELEPIAAARGADTVTLTFEDRTFDLLPTDVGFAIDVEGSVEAALARGRSGLPGDIATRIRSFRESVEIPLTESLDDDALAGFVAEIAEELDQDEVRGDVAIDPEGPTVTLQASQRLVAVDQDAVITTARQALLVAGSEEVEIAAEVGDTPIDNDELAGLAAQVEAAIDGPLVLRSDTAELELGARDLAELIEIAETDGGTTGTTLTMRVTEERVEDVMGDVAPDRFAVSAQNATYSASRTPPQTFDVQGSGSFSPVAAEVGIEGGRVGKAFDAELAAQQLTELLRDGVREAGIRLVDVEPDLSPARAEELRPTHAIGTFTTYYQAGQVRNQNIQLLADTVDGTLVLPGEQFSINAISGERSCEKGYQPAGTIVRGELVDTCGGGTSQFGTTTFNAAFFAGVQLDQWRAHSWYISRYPMGREATLSYPVLDVVFTNTTDGAILVKTAHTSTSVTVTLYGQPIAESVRATHSAPFNDRSFSTDTRSTSDLRQGQERVVQAGTNGFTVDVVRDVALIGGGSDSQTIRTVYVPQTRIVERGTAAAPSPPDEDDDAGDDEEDDDADDD